ncbi:MAG: hypothetical protein Q4F99_05830 [bacterium]|nr:hypothetical protein [bacterium]
MSRKLNIERRRKRIRHYTARRRQRSVVRRAFSYWWSTVLVLLFVLFALAHTMIWFYPRATADQATFALPHARESMRYVSKEEINAFLTKGTFQQTSQLLSDEDVGISLNIAIPEVPAYRPQPFGESPQLPDEKRSFLSLHLLPNAYTDEMALNRKPVPTCTHVLSPSLIAAGYAFTLPSLPHDRVEDATFLIETNAQGNVESVLRLQPKGAESDVLRKVRFALQKGSAKGATEGTIHFQWRKETLK